LVAPNLSQAFPNLTNNYQVTSPATTQYNCIAWAASRDDSCWWPSLDGVWPQGVSREITLAAFEAAFATIRYRRCENASLEPNLEKIVIYVDTLGFPTHAARQLPNGRWTSKLGKNVDIEHATPEAVNCPTYGTPALFMARQINRVF
jgi:hypothetical protein